MRMTNQMQKLVQTAKQAAEKAAGQTSPVQILSFFILSFSIRIGIMILYISRKETLQ